MEHTPKSIAYLRAAYHEISLVYVMKFYVLNMYVNLLLNLLSFLVNRIQ